MATLVLTAVGTAVGGPIGGALGALVGQQIDQNVLFKPAGREGPRIQELAVQTSSYGTQIPRIFGRMRVAGSVFWATDLKETKNTEGGKGRPKTTTYSYSACFAVALSSRPIRRIGRIWADGKIFRGAAGDFKTATGFRVFNGHEDQLQDSLIASAEGTGSTPGYRGLAFAVFEEMELADYGNRIPSLTFEIIADDGSVNLVDIVDDLSGHRISLSSQEQLHGYAASGRDRRAALEPIADNYRLSFSTDRGQISGRSRLNFGTVTAQFKRDLFVIDVNGAKAEPSQFETVSETKIPRQLTLRYYEPERDYQSGLQIGFRPGVNRITVQQDFPAVISASRAKSLVQNQLWNLSHERSNASMAVPNSGFLGKPGNCVQLDGQRIWTIRSYEFRAGVIFLSLSSTGNSLDIGDPETEGGRSVPDQDLAAGATKLALFDLPFSPDAPNQASESVQLFAIGGGEKGWRNADLYQVLADGSVGGHVGRISSPGILGTVEDVFQPSSALLSDQKTSIIVQLHNTNMDLSYADKTQLSAGKNIALIGKEIVQFAKAKALGNGRYMLSGFYRGLGGTERHIESHDTQENFVLFEPSAATLISPSHVTPFEPTRFAALGRDDTAPVYSETIVPGIALKPWEPVHLKHRFNNSGDLEFTWTRRSRAGSSWMDYVDVPIVEDTEEYWVRWTNNQGELLGEKIVEDPRYEVMNSLISSYQMEGVSQIQFRVKQLGRYSASEEVSAMVPI